MSKWNDSDIVTFGARSFALTGETQENALGEWTNERIWVIGQPHSKIRTLLPIPPLVRDSPFPFDRFVVSPDERVILGERKRGSHQNAVYVFHRTSGLHFHLADSVPLHKRIDQQVGVPPETRKRRWNDDNTAQFTLFQSWQPNGRDALFACLYGEGSRGIWYLVTLNTHTGKLSGYQKLDDNRIMELDRQNERFPQTRLRPMSRAEVAALSPADVSFAIDELLARRGYSFPNNPKRAAWFEVNDYDYANRNAEPGLSQAAIEARMFPTERANLALLMQAQAAAARPYKR